MSPDDFRNFVAAGSFAIAAASLATTAFNTYVDRRNRELDALLSMWKRYEEYGIASGAAGNALLKAETPTPELSDQFVAAFLNTANFIENLCLIFHRRSPSRIILINIENLVLDYIVGTERRMIAAGTTYLSYLSMYISSRDTFVETRRFIVDHRRQLSQRGHEIEESPLFQIRPSL